MPLTQLDAVAALIVIDLQKGIVALPTAHPTAEVVQRSAELARAFRRHNLPVVLVNVTAAAPGRTDTPRPVREFPPDWAELVPELDRHPTDHLVSKQRVGAFLGTDLDAYLRSRAVTQVILTGVATTAGVESTARSAFDLGYHVVFATDAMTDMSAENHRHAIEKIFPRFGQCDSTSAILNAVSTRAQTN
jgi:nicotinamidase-related amidase